MTKPEDSPMVTVALGAGTTSRTHCRIGSPTPVVESPLRRNIVNLFTIPKGLNNATEAIPVIHCLFDYGDQEGLYFELEQGRLTIETESLGRLRAFIADFEANEMSSEVSMDIEPFWPYLKLRQEVVHHWRDVDWWKGTGLHSDFYRSEAAKAAVRQANENELAFYWRLATFDMFGEGPAKRPPVLLGGVPYWKQRSRPPSRLGFEFIAQVSASAVAAAVADYETYVFADAARKNVYYAWQTA